MLRGWAFCLGLVALVGMSVVAAEVQAQDEAGAAAAAEQTSHLNRLIDALQNDDSYKVRLQAAVFLGRSGEERSVAPLLKTIGTDEHYTVRAAAATALANLGDPAAIPRIIRQAAVDTEPFVREEASRALNKYDREEALPYVIATYNSDDARVREEVVRYLADGASEGAKGVLIRALGDVPEILTYAKDVLKKMPPEKRLEFLGAAVEHRDPGVRRGAVEVLHQEASKEATEVVLQVYERDIESDQVRDATRKALRGLRRFLPLDQIVLDAHGSPDKYLRARALKLLGVVGGSKAQTALLAALEDEEVYLRGTAVMALRELGDPQTIPDLEKLLQDPQNQRIARQIRTAVKHLRRQPGAP